MAISRIGSASAQATTIAIPSHQAGDIIVISANRNNTTPPTVPAGWITQVSTGASGTGNSIGWRMATSNGETSGTWANATSLHVAVYRGSAGILAISAAAGGQAATSTSVSYPALTNGLTYRAGVLDNWYIGAAIQLNSANSLETPPSGFANINVESIGGTHKTVLHDTNGSQLSNWATSATTVTTSAAYLTRVVQLFEFTGPAFGGGGGGIFFRPGMSGGMSE